ARAHGFLRAQHDEHRAVGNALHDRGTPGRATLDGVAVEPYANAVRLQPAGECQRPLAIGAGVADEYVRLRGLLSHGATPGRYETLAATQLAYGVGRAL